MKSLLPGLKHLHLPRMSFRLVVVTIHERERIWCYMHDVMLIMNVLSDTEMHFLPHIESRHV